MIVNELDLKNDDTGYISKVLREVVGSSSFKQPPKLSLLNLYVINYLEAYASTLAVSDATRGFPKYSQWAKTKPSRAGSSFEERVKFWAAEKSNMPACPFMVEKTGEVILPIGFYYNRMVAFNTSIIPGKYSLIESHSVYEVIPIFDRNLLSAYKRQGYQEGERVIATVIPYMAEWARLRKAVLKRLNQEPVSELDDVFNTRALGGSISNNTVLNVNYAELEERVAASLIKPEGKQEMSKSKQIAHNMIEANKEAAKDLAFLNAGRVANKTIKTAMTPILKLLVKPTFMQRAVMKLTGAKDPIEAFLESPISDLLAAEGFKLALEIKGVEQGKLQETANKAIVYAGLQVTDKIPLEGLMDAAIAEVATALEKTSVLDKLTKKGD